jgi:hypothetical protein
MTIAEDSEHHAYDMPIPDVHPRNWIQYAAAVTVSSSDRNGTAGVHNVLLYWYFLVVVAVCAAALLRFQWEQQKKLGVWLQPWLFGHSLQQDAFPVPSVHMEQKIVVGCSHDCHTGAAGLLWETMKSTRVECRSVRVRGWGTS